MKNFLWTLSTVYVKDKRRFGDRLRFHLQLQGKITYSVGPSHNE
jgi:hypothetical protein